MVSKKWAAGTAATLVAMLLPAVALPGSAAAQTGDSFHIAKTLGGGYPAPLQFAVGQRVYVADSGTSTLSSITPHVVYAHGGDPSKNGDLAGVAVYSPYGEVAYTYTNNESHSITKFVLLKGGKMIWSTNLAAYEAKQNPDGGTTYGAVNPNACQRKALNNAHIPISYRGGKDSHPYASTYIGNHQWAVADAGGNDILRIDTLNHVVSTLAVIPPQAFTVTKAFADDQHLPSCTRGLVYTFESVPTDVELGPHGYVYVSTLPGGPEGGPGVYPRGHIIKISPAGQQITAGTQFDSPTNIAVTPGGNIFVAELGRGVISAVKFGSPKIEMHLPGVVAVEWANNHLYAATAPFLTGGKSPGKVYLLDKN